MFQFDFTLPLILGPGRALVVGVYEVPEEDDDPRAAIFEIRDGTWSALDVVTGYVRGLGLLQDPPGQVVALERDRTLFRMQEGSRFVPERIDDSRDGFFSELRQVAGQWFVVGTENQVFCRTASGWRAADAGLYEPEAEPDRCMLLSIHGTAPDDLYAVGLGGAIHHWDGARWRTCEEPTDYGLTRVLALDREHVLACGYGDTVLLGNHAGWKRLSPLGENVCWDLGVFADRVWITAGTKLMTLDRDFRLEVVAPPLEGPLSYERLSASTDGLWLCGGDCVIEYDGRAWRRHRFPQAPG